MRGMSGIDDRGVSELVGTLLIVSVVLIVSLVILGTGMYAIEQTLSDTDDDVARQSMLSLDDKMTELSESDTETTTTFEVPSNAAQKTEAQNDDFEVTFEIETADGYWEVTDPNGQLVQSSDQTSTKTQTYGTITHEAEDGTVTAYQGGAVWEMQDGNVRMVSEPSLSIDGKNLALNFVDLSDVELVQQGNELELTKDPGASATKTENITQLVDNQTRDDDGDVVADANVTLVIETEFAQGWKAYAENLDTVGEDNVTLTSDDTVEIYLGQFGDGLENVPESPNFDDDVIYSGLAEYAPMLHDDSYSYDLKPLSPKGYEVDNPDTHWDDYKVGMLYEHDGPNSGDLDWWVYNETEGKWVNLEDPTATNLDTTVPDPVDTVDTSDDEFAIDDSQWVCTVNVTDSSDEFRDFVADDDAGCLEEPIDVANADDHVANFEPYLTIDHFNTTAYTDGEVVPEDDSPPKRLDINNHEVHVNASVTNTGTGNGSQPVGIIRDHEDGDIGPWITAGDRPFLNRSESTWINTTVNFSIANENKIRVGTPTDNAGPRSYMVAVNVSDAYFKVEDIDVVNDPIDEGEELKVDVTVNNTEDGGDEATRTIPLLDGNDIPVTGEEYTLAPSDPPETKTFVWNTTRGDASTDEITIVTGDEEQTASVQIDQVVEEPEYKIHNVTSNSPVEEEEELTVEAEIENVGAGDDPQSVVLWDGSQFRDVVNAEISSGETETVELSWQTALGDEGQYTLDVDAQNEQETIDVEVQRETPDTNYNITQMDPANSAVDVGEDIAVDVTVENQGSEGGKQDVWLTDFDGDVVDWKQDVELSPGDSESFTLTWPTTAGDAGSGTIAVENLDDRETQTVLVRGENYDPPEFEVSIDDTNASVDNGDSVKVGESVTVDMTVENVGGSPDEQTVVLEDFDGSPVNATDVFLAGGESKTITLSWFTAGVDAGESGVTGDVTATVNDDDDTEEVKIEPREIRRQPVDVAFVIDETGSMGGDGCHWFYGCGVTLPGNDEDEVRVDAIKSAVGGLNGTKGDRGSLTMFSTSEPGDATTYLQMTGDLDNINQSIETDPGGGTDIAAGMSEGLSELDRAASERSQPHKKVMLVLTDGEDNDGQSPGDWASDHAGDDLTVYTVGFGGANDAVLQNVANTAGDGEGTFYKGQNAEELDEIFDEVIGEVTDVEPPNIEITGVSVEQDPVTEPAPINVTATVENTGDGIGDQPVMLVDGDGMPVDSGVVNVSSGSQDTITFSWDSSGVVDWTNESGDTATVPFTVETPDDSQSDQVDVEKGAQNIFEINDVATDDPVEEGETLTFDIELENTGGADGTQAVWVYDQDGNPLVSQSVDLDSGQSDTVSLDWTTRVGDRTVDTVTVETDNDNQTNNVTVEPAQDTTSEFEVSVLDSNANATAGQSITAGSDTLDVTVDVANTGNASAVQTIILEDSFGEPRASETVSLGSGDRDNATIRWDTQAPDFETDEITVKSNDDNDTHAVDIVRDVGDDSEFTITSVDSNGNATADRSIDIGRGEDLKTNITVKNEGDLGKQIVRLQDPTTGDLLPGNVSREVSLVPGATENFNITWSSAATKYDNVTVATNDDTRKHPVNITRAAEADDVELTITDANATDPDDVVVAGDGDVNVTVQVDDADSDFTLTLRHPEHRILDLKEGVSDGDEVTLTWDTQPRQGDTDPQEIWVEAQGSNKPGVDVYVDVPDALDPSEANFGDDGDSVDISVDEIQVS